MKYLEFTTDNIEQNKITDSNNTIYVKKCNNNCGKNIYWDKSNNYFVETDSQKRHVCPNWNRNIDNANIRELNNTLICNQSQIIQTLNTILTRLDTIESKIVQSQKGDV